jgi:hypothetical protein
MGMTITTIEITIRIGMTTIWIRITIVIRVTITINNKRNKNNIKRTMNDLQAHACQKMWQTDRKTNMDRSLNCSLLMLEHEEHLKSRLRTSACCLWMCVVWRYIKTYVQIMLKYFFASQQLQTWKYSRVPIIWPSVIRYSVLSDVPCQNIPFYQQS